MSGIRAHDPERLELGLMLPGFVERSKAVARNPAAGPLQGVEMPRNFKARVADRYMESLRRIQAHGGGRGSFRAAAANCAGGRTRRPDIESDLRARRGDDVQGL